MANVLPLIRSIVASGVKRGRAIAATLNARGVKTTRGGQWHEATVPEAAGASATRREGVDVGGVYNWRSRYSNPLI